jgi:hypothetical protein
LLRLLAKRGKDFPSQVCLESLAEEILPGEFARAAGANRPAEEANPIDVETPSVFDIDNLKPLHRNTLQEVPLVSSGPITTMSKISNVKFKFANHVAACSIRLGEDCRLVFMTLQLLETVHSPSRGC